MWPNHTLRMHSSAQLIQPPTPSSLPPPQLQCTSIEQCHKLSRRNLTNSSLLLLMGSQILEPISHPLRARAEDILQNAEQIVPEEGPKEAEDILQNAKQIVPEEGPKEAEDILQKAEQIVPEEGPKEAEDILQNSEQIVPDEGPKEAADPCAEKMVTKKVFLDVSIDGAPVGRIVIGLYGDSVPFGAARISDLVSGAAGISYRRKEFVKITPSYVQHGGVRSYGVDAELARQAGKILAADRLMDEWEKQYENCAGTKNVATTIGLVVRDPLKPPPKMKLVARQGKLEIDQEELGSNPNGTEFVISIRDSPELDSSTLVVGKVLEGLDAIEKISQVKTVQENTSSPYFRVAKLVGDKRAVVAERGFNRPYSKVVVTNCGLMKE